MKLPLAYSLKNRASSLDEDAKLLNGYVESRGDPKKGGLTTVEKRPALDVAFELTSGSGQALYVTNIPNVDGSQSDVLGTVIGDILTRAPTPVTKRLQFGVQPSDVALNTAISPAVTVTIRNSLGQLVNSSANVTIALAANATGATLGGTLTQAASAGTATFNDLTLNRSGETFTLRATSPTLNSGVSNKFTISTSLVFTTQPSFASFAPTVGTTVVTVRDSAGATDTNYTGNITVAIFSGSGTLSGTTTVAAVSGVATFSSLSITPAGTYDLQATAEAISTAYSPSRVVSASFSNNGTFAETAGSDSGIFGFIKDNSGPGLDLGSITPTTFLGSVIAQLSSDTTGGSTNTLFKVNGIYTQGAFTSLTVDALTPLLSASATSFSAGGGGCKWTWDNQVRFTAATSYAVVFA